MERAPAPRPGGQTVDLRGVGRDVVERMGIMSLVCRDRVDERGIALVDRTGRRIAELPADLFGGEGIVAEIEIMRGDLSRILNETIGGDVEYRFGDRIVALTQGADGVDVTFASGAARRFDLVVGADGVHSGVRELAFGPESDFVRHLGAYSAYFSVPDPGDLKNWFLMYNAPGGLVAGIRPERGGTAKASLGFTSPPLDYERRDVRGQQQVSSTGWPARAGECLICSRRCPARPTSTSTRSARCTWTGGGEGAWHWSAMPATAALPWPVSAPACRSSVRTSSPAS